MGNKRQVNHFLRRVLDFDVAATNKFCSFSNNFAVSRTIRNHAKALEISCHGLPWFVCVTTLIWMTSSAEWHQMEINLLFGLIIDLIIVCSLKAATRRRRPGGNKPDAFFEYGPDKFSFPSGHASRAVFLCCFFIHLWPLSFIFVPPLCAWVTCVAISRVLLRRHHLLDVLCGCFVGLFVSLILYILWLPPGVTNWLVSYLSTEAFEGASFDV